MDYTYFIPLISFCGLIFGIFLAKIAREEIRPGVFYFFWLKKVILGCLIILLFLNIEFSLIWLLFLGVVFGYLSGLYTKVYFYLGLCSTISFIFSKELFFLINIFIFLFGLPEGTLYKRSKFARLYKNFIFFIVPFLFLIFFFDVLADKPSLINLLIGICSGGLFNFLLRRSFINF